MAEKKPFEQFPWWVKFPLLGFASRSWAMASMWGCLFVSGVLIVAGLFRPLFFVSAALFFAGAIAYGKAIRWVDQHGQWPPEPPQSHG